MDGVEAAVQLRQSQEILPEDIPLPRDSMVTVRLSDPVSEAEIVQSPESIQQPPYEHPERIEQADCAEDDAVAHPPQQLADVPAAANGDVGSQCALSLITDPLHLTTEAEGNTSTPGQSRPASSRSVSPSSESCDRVDWDGLERSEERQSREEGSDESVAFLLARLEQENNALATDPKSNLSRTRAESGFRQRAKSRPPSIQQLQRLVNSQSSPSVRHSIPLTPPPMTELEFYAALVADYPRTAQCLPTLLLKKIRGGIPPPLRGVVWMSMSGARDQLLEGQFDRLANESSPYENMIGKDIGRSFPGVEMFRDPDGDGQRKLGRVLKCFSLYDHKIGYCQGLGFLVGPLLMNMGDKEAFCVLVRLMEQYDLRSCFLPDLSGLHLRIYQFQRLLTQYLPTVSRHFEKLQIEPAYVSQWFLSFFAVTCPLPMLLRIYDVIFAEGAAETMMRVSLAVIKRNESKILASTEFEDVMQLLLSRSLWDAYDCDADGLVDDFVALTGVVTHDGLKTLTANFKEARAADGNAKAGSFPDLQAAASRFLGRLWTGSNSSTKSATLSTGLAAPSRPSSFLQRVPSKQSIASTLNSYEGGSESAASTVPTEMTTMSRQSSITDCGSVKSNSGSLSLPIGTLRKDALKDKDLHCQIEDLLTALSEMQREQAVLNAQLQEQREEREEDRKAVSPLLDRLRVRSSLETVRECDEHISETLISASPPEDIVISSSEEDDDLQSLVAALSDRFSKKDNGNRASITETKQQLREELKRSRELYTLQLSRSTDLDRRLTEQEKELSQMREQLRDARSHIQDGLKEKQRMDKTVQDLRACKSPLESSSTETPVGHEKPPPDPRFSVQGLREFRLKTSGPEQTQTAPTFSKRTSSLGAQALLGMDSQPHSHETLLMDLVNSKTAEAVAKQEAEELRSKLDSLRKMLGLSGSSPTAATSHQSRPSQPTLETGHALSRTTSQTSAGSGLTPISSSSRGPSPVSAAVSAGSSFWGGWGKRSVSSTVAESRTS
ncbi:MAG: hypothetical protein M1833_000492 [Piccolia ochrophora]|nr:MAG: hypothetical protein M1833_000492 [Piccolia ochrophora]